LLSRSALRAYDKGYRVVGLEVIGLRGKPIKLKSYDHYPKFNMWHEGRVITIKVHQLVAWQKFGKKCIGKDVVVRHDDDQEWNFEPHNILLGTMDENYKDMHRNRRKRLKEDPY